MGGGAPCPGSKEEGDKEGKVNEGREKKWAPPGE